MAHLCSRVLGLAPASIIQMAQDVRKSSFQVPAVYSRKGLIEPVYECLCWLSATILPHSILDGGSVADGFDDWMATVIMSDAVPL